MVQKQDIKLDERDPAELAHDHTAATLTKWSNDTEKQSSGVQFTARCVSIRLGYISSRSLGYHSSGTVQVDLQQSDSVTAERKPCFINKLHDFLHHAAYIGKAALTLCSVKLRLTFWKLGNGAHD